MKKYFIGIAVLFFALACQTLMPTASGGAGIPAVDSTQGIHLAVESTVAAQWTLQASTPNADPSLFFSPTPTFSPSPTFTNSPIPTLAFIRQGPDAVTIPILLYHRIETPDHQSMYYIPPETFDEQLNLLHEWGYTTITLDMLLEAIRQGADLPARPIIITFDDGQESVYTTALPIMQKYGFKGVAYIVGTYMDAETFMTTDQVKALIAAGWEIGSHSMSHKDLTKLDSTQLRYEIFESRKLLSEKLGVPVNSFAYPWGFANDVIFSAIHNAGYTTAMGLGYSNYQSTWNLLLLQRRDVISTYDLKKFAFFLPWQGDSSFLPTDTPTPTPRPTRTPRPTKSK